MTHGNDAQSVLRLDDEEYRQVRAEMVDRDTFIRTTYLFSVSAVGALAWGITDLYLDHQQAAEKVMWWIMYLPALACVPLLFVMIAQRRDLVRGGAYIRVFFEDRISRKGWQGRKEQFMIRIKGESNDRIIWFYYVVLIGCILINRSLSVPFSWLEGALAVFVGVSLGVGHWKFYSAAEQFRQQCLREWECVLRRESS